MHGINGRNYIPCTTYVWKALLQIQINKSLQLSWILPITDSKPVGIKKDEIDKCSFLKLLYANKGLDVINLH